MRAKHAPHSLQAFPVYSASFISDDKLALGGGGGSSRSGIKNKLRLYKIENERHLELISELELDKGEDAPMSMATDINGSRIICGINSAAEKLDKGENENCRLFTIERDKFNLVKTVGTLKVTSANMEECQRVTTLSPAQTLVAASGEKDLTVLSYPLLVPITKPLHTESEIYDAAFSPTTLAVATTSSLLIYKIPTADPPSTSSPSKKSRSKKKNPKASTVSDLDLVKTVERPALPGASPSANTFRAIRFNPSNPQFAYTVQNATLSDARSRGSRMAPKQGFICRWNTENWQAVKIRKIGERGITCFDISANGKYLAYGAADYSIGILDATTLAPLLSVLRAHEFPPTVIRFNPSATLLVSGSADNTIRAVAIPETLTGTTWTTRSVFFLTVLILLLSILASYLYTNEFFN